MTRPLAIAMAEGVGAAIVPIDDPGSPTDFSPIWIDWPEVAGTIGRIERDDSPRWVWWPESTPRALVAVDVRPARSWDLGAVHRLLVGGWRNSPAAIWANCHDLDGACAPEPAGAPDLFSAAAEAVDEDDPIRSMSGHLSPEWLAGGLARHTGSYHAPCPAGRRVLPPSAGAGASRRRGDRRPTITGTVYSESAAESLCAELEHDGLPIDRRRRRGPDRRLHRSAAGRRGRTRHALAVERDERRAPAHPGRPTARSPQSGQREGTATTGRYRGVGHPGVAARGVARRPSVRRRPAHMAQGRADLDDVRVRLARRQRRRRRPAAGPTGRDRTAPRDG